MGARAGDSTQLPDLCASSFLSMLSPSMLVLQRSSEAVGRRYPLASELELYHLSPCFSHEGKPCFLFSVQLLYPSPEERGLLSAWLETGDPVWTWGTGTGILCLVFHVLPRARTVVAPLAFFGELGVGVLTFILIFILIFGSCVLLANTYVQVTAFYL